METARIVPRASARRTAPEQTAVLARATLNGQRAAARSRSRAA